MVLLSFLRVAEMEEIEVVSISETSSRKKNFVFMISDFDNTKLALKTPLSQGRKYGF
jgi:hypothetical protein